MRKLLPCLLFLIAVAGFVARHSAGPAASSISSQGENAGAHTSPSPVAEIVGHSPSLNGVPRKQETASPSPSYPETQSAVLQAEANAVKLYPALGVQGSRLNERYRAEYRRRMAETPSFFNDPSWPILLARQVVGTSADASSTAIESVRNTPLQAGSGLSGPPVCDLTIQNILSAGDYQRFYSSFGDAIPTANYPGPVYSIPNSGSGGSNHDIDFAHRIGVGITFRIPGERPPPGEFTIEWFFVGKEVNSKKRWIFESGSNPLTGWDYVLVASKPLEETRINESRYSFTTQPISEEEAVVNIHTVHTKGKTGNKIEGWIVRLKDRGQVVRVEASLYELREFADQSQEQLDESIKMSNR